MEEFIYAAWLRDLELEPEDQDYEWPACILIRAPSATEALGWGDHLSRLHCERHPEYEFLRSYVEPADAYADAATSGVPVVEVGTEVSDAYIGW